MTKGRKINFNKNWLFWLGDGDNFQDTSFDDSNFIEKTLPHDWSTEYSVDENNLTGAGGGYVKAGIGWYRKYFEFEERFKNRIVELLFDGVFMDSVVYINGHRAGGCRYGYSSFSVDISKYLQKGKNVVAVKVNNSKQPNSRWYTGSGIYRNVYIKVSERIHISTWGVSFHTEKLINNLKKAVLQVSTIVENSTKDRTDVGIYFTMYDKEGKLAGSFGAPLSLESGEEGKITVKPEIENIHMWTDEDPYLYTLKTVLKIGNEIMDERETKVGIRTATFDCDRGFLLNGQSVKINGMCIHHDCGLTGAVAYKNTLKRRLRALKEMGCNGIRCSHNPPSVELLDLCDELGFLVMDEAFDEWMLAKDKNRNYYTENLAYGSAMFFDKDSEKILKSMISRDRNHPSVILWSIGNEIPEQTTKEGVEILKKLRDICHSEDPSRMVTLACDNIVAPESFRTLREFENELDVVGYNYVGRWRERAETLYEEDRHLYPKRRFCGSENPSVGGYRGVYGPMKNAPIFMSRFKYTTATLNNEWLFRYTKSRDYVAGDYLWTGIDYLGEAPWPSRGAAAAPIDTAGIPKDSYYYFQSIWNPNKITLHILPHWNFKGDEGEFKQIIAYTNCEEVELFINDRLVGKKSCHGPKYGCTKAWNDRPKINVTTNDLHLEWDVPYEPGELRAVGYINDEKVAETCVNTTSVPVKLVAKTDVENISVGEVAHIDISTLDKKRLFVPDAGNEIEISVSGNIRYLGMDNGNLLDHTLYGSQKRNLFSGRLMAMIYGTKKGKGVVKISAKGMDEIKLEYLIE